MPLPIDDLASEVLEAVYQSMSIDELWSFRDERSFTWWPHRLRQRIWAEPARERDGAVITRVHAEVPLARSIDARPDLAHLLARENALADLSALVLDPESGHVYRRCSGYFHKQNRWLITTFQAAAALQVAQAEAELDSLVAALSGQPDLVPHPTSGGRRKPDEMLAIADLFVSSGAKPSPFREGEFKRLMHDGEGLWLVATYGASSAAAELEFFDRVPATLDEPLPDDRAARTALADAYADAGRREGKAASEIHGVVWTVACREGHGLGTAMLQLRADEPHPELGSGLLATLRLPVRLSEMDAAARAQELNLAECTEWTDAHQLGAWCARGAELAFVSFLPGLIASNEGPKSRRARLVNTVSAMVIRAKWAAQKLSGDRFARRVQ